MLPEIIASLGFKWIMNNVLNNNMMLAVQVGGFLMILAALTCFFLINEKKTEPSDPIATAEMEIISDRSI